MAKTKYKCPKCKHYTRKIRLSKDKDGGYHQWYCPCGYEGQKIRSRK